MATDLLVPMFSRPAAPGPEESLYLHALSRAALLATPGPVARVDRQLIAMIDSARARPGRPLDPRVWLVGHSASAMFVNRFTVLHPERVRAVAISSPGGWPIAPVTTARGQRLTYPVGIADLDQLDRPVELARLRKVPQLFLLGAKDDNDAVPYRDAFSTDDEATIMHLFGANPVARWPEARRLYEAAGLDAQFKLYPDTGHEVTRAMLDDIAAAFARVAGRP